jgi:hypothetical protein
VVDDDEARHLSLKNKNATWGFNLHGAAPIEQKKKKKKKKKRRRQMKLWKIYSVENF